ncbi:NADP-dependent 3-hydroxy acid dehydrogenase YdfG [Crossiella equi]|uniref:NADP-dependent 3-hydroxy acid dehydrogenase YdfG n=1 Tax=Crossiella equi TaxID=130796 RepID=A0ABS5AGY5_9PSEU|nr:SDR family oxidoreductase [Crossiella equi]MBP2475611.1 NADP-dependent 3-hydroxy acid dehydrogenase YdfG [Crossiella equi]
MSNRPLALVTGASRGIGRATAHALAPTHDLLLGGRDPQALAALAAELPGTATPWAVDLSDTDALTAATADIARLDLLVHSAGVAELGAVADTPAKVWRETYEINVVAVAELTRLLLPALRRARGTVVLVNSGAGLRANPGWGAYAASKFALRALADALRAEEEPHGVRVTSVHPGRTATDMQRGIRTAEGADYNPENYLTPESVAAAVLAAATAGPDAHVTEIVIRPAAR